MWMGLKQGDSRLAWRQQSRLLHHLISQSGEKLAQKVICDSCCTLQVNFPSLLNPTFNSICMQSDTWHANKGLPCSKTFSPAASAFNVEQSIQTCASVSNTSAGVRARAQQANIDIKTLQKQHQIPGKAECNWLISIYFGARWPIRSLGCSMITSLSEA